MKKNLLLASAMLLCGIFPFAGGIAGTPVPAFAGGFRQSPSGFPLPGNAGEPVPAVPSSGTTDTVSMEIGWMLFEEALQENAARVQAGLPAKKVYVDVYTQWCGWCKKLDATTFAHPEIIAYMNSVFLPVKLDAERTDTVRVNQQVFVNPGSASGKRGTHQIAVALLNGKMSYPSCTFLDEQGKVITVVPGYMDAGTFEALLHFIGEDAYKSMTWESFQDWFKERARVR